MQKKTNKTKSEQQQLPRLLYRHSHMDSKFALLVMMLDMTMTFLIQEQNSHFFTPSMLAQRLNKQLHSPKFAAMGLKLSITEDDVRSFFGLLGRLPEEVSLVNIMEMPLETLMQRVFSGNSLPFAGDEDFQVLFYDSDMVCHRELLGLDDCVDAVDFFTRCRADGAVMTMDSTWNQAAGRDMINVSLLTEHLSASYHADYCIEVVPAQLKMWKSLAAMERLFARKEKAAAKGSVSNMVQEQYVADVGGELETRTVYVCPTTEVHDNFFCDEIEGVQYGMLFKAVQERHGEQGKLTWQNVRYFLCSLGYDAENSGMVAMNLLNYHWPIKEETAKRWVIELSWPQDALKRNADFLVGKNRIVNDFVQAHMDPM